MQLNTVLEQLLFTTARITTVDAAGNHGLGTGFFYSWPTGTGTTGYCLVTNKHVIENAVSATVHMIAADKDGKPLLGKEIAYDVPTPQKSFVGHPDPDIDVAATAMYGVLATLQAAGTSVLFKAVDESMLATPAVLDQFEPIEPVTFIGYPNGLYDTHSLLPIVRRGHSATALGIDYQNKPIFLVDASVFPGSSGSPVFLIAPASVPDKFGNISLGKPTQVVFLGVVAAVYQRNVPVLTAGGGAPFVYDALDIGIVYKASTVDTLMKHMMSTTP